MIKSYALDYNLVYNPGRTCNAGASAHLRFPLQSDEIRIINYKTASSNRTTYGANAGNRIFDNASKKNVNLSR